MFPETENKEKPGQDSLSHFYLPKGFRADLTLDLNQKAEKQSGLT